MCVCNMRCAVCECVRECVREYACKERPAVCACMGAGRTQKPLQTKLNPDVMYVYGANYSICHIILCHMSHHLMSYVTSSYVRVWSKLQHTLMACHIITHTMSHHHTYLCTCMEQTTACPDGVYVCGCLTDLNLTKLQHIHQAKLN